MRILGDFAMDCCYYPLKHEKSAADESTTLSRAQSTFEGELSYE